MKYTKEQLQAMSNKDVTIALARLLLDKHGAPYFLNDTVTVTKLEEIRGDTHPDAIEVVCGFSFRLDYCNTPNDIMPLAFKHGIWIQSVDGRDGRYWTAGANTYHAFQHDNPLRAIACCLILVLQGEKE